MKKNKEKNYPFLVDLLWKFYLLLTPQTSKHFYHLFSTLIFDRPPQIIEQREFQPLNRVVCLGMLSTATGNDKFMM